MNCNELSQWRHEKPPCRNLSFLGELPALDCEAKGGGRQVPQDHVAGSVQLTGIFRYLDSPLPRQCAEVGA